MFNPFIGVTKVISAEVSGKFAELQTKVDNIQSKGYDDTQLRNSIQQLSSAISSGIVVDAYTKLETNNLLSTKVNVSDFNEYKEQISSELSSIVDNNIIYDDTEIKADISELSSKLENLEITGEIYDDTEIKADISELSSKLENLVDNDTIYDDTQLRSLISAETDARILEDTSLSSQIEILKLEKGDDYTAFEVFPHNFSLQAAGSIISGTQKTVGEMFSNWHLIPTSKTYNQDAYNYLNRLYKFDGEYKRFHPVSGYISITQQKIADASQLPQIGDVNVFYEIDANNRYFYFDEAIRNLRNGLTTAADTDLLFRIRANTNAVIRFRTKLSTTQLDEGKSDVIIDWGDNTYSKFSEYTTYNGSWYAFIHEYSQQNINKNHIIKIYGKDYYCIDWQNSGAPSIVSRAFDYDLPVASHLKNFSNFFTTNLVYKVDFKRCTHSFEECNVASMFINTNIQHIYGLNLGQHQGLQNAFVSLYSMNCMFQTISVLNDLEFVFPAYTTYANGNNYTQYCTNIFQNIYFNYGKEAFDILTLFGQFSFSQMPKGITINVAGMFNKCKNITCSNVEKLGKFLWNNPNINWTNTSSVFANVTADFLSGVPVEWGGLLTGWTAPTENTFDDTEIRNLISAETENRILEDNKLNTAITQLSSVVTNAYSKLETDDLLSAKLDTNTFDEYANQISEELSALTITDTNISTQVNVLDKKVNLLQAEKSNDYTAFEVFPHDFKLEGSNLNNNTIVTVAQAFANSEYAEYRKCLTSANDDDIFFTFNESKTLYLRFRSYLSKDQITAGVADVVIDWGDNTPVSSYIDATINGSYYDFIHVYEEPYINTNCIVKIYGKDYKDVRTMSYLQPDTNGNGQSIVVRAIDYDLPVASHLTAFPSFLANTMIYSLRADRCPYLFDNSNLSEAFRIRTLQRIYGFSTATMKHAFSTSYCLNKVFSGNDVINSIDFKFPARIELPEIHEVFKDVYFNYGKSAFDILKLFDDYSFTNISPHLTLIPAGMFNGCKNITCSNVEKLGKFLWNNPNVKWTNTSSVFANVTADFLSGVPVEWGGTLTGWVPPVENTFDDTEIRNEISGLQNQINQLQISGGIYDDTGIVQQISTISSEIQQLNTLIKTDGTGTKFLADDGNYYQIVTSNNGANSGENTGDTNIGTSSQVLDINALSTYLDENGYLQEIPAEFITETQLKQKNYIDEQYLTTNNYVNQQYLTQQEYMRSLDIYEHPVVLELIEHINTLYTRITQLSEKIQTTKTNVDNNLISVVWDQQESNTDSASGQIL